MLYRSLYSFRWDIPLQIPLNADASIFLNHLVSFLHCFWKRVWPTSSKKRNEKSFQSLNEANDDIPVRVVRNHNVWLKPRREIVVDDVVILEQGEKIPEDCKLLESLNRWSPSIWKYCEHAGISLGAEYSIVVNQAIGDFRE